MMAGRVDRHGIDNQGNNPALNRQHVALFLRERERERERKREKERERERERLKQGKKKDIPEVKKKIQKSMMAGRVDRHGIDNQGSNPALN